MLMGVPGRRDWDKLLEQIETLCALMREATPPKPRLALPKVKAAYYAGYFDLRPHDSAVSAIDAALREDRDEFVVAVRNLSRHTAEVYIDVGGKIVPRNDPAVLLADIEALLAPKL